MDYSVCIIGGGLAGSEAALQAARQGLHVSLVEARPLFKSPVHKTNYFAELVCSNSFKSEKPQTAAGMLKAELAALHSFLLEIAYKNRVPAGGALALDRNSFALDVTNAIESNPLIDIFRLEVCAINADGSIKCNQSKTLGPFDAIIIATGPLTTTTFASWLQKICGENNLAFYDAAAPILFADSLDYSKVFSQSRYKEGAGDYLNAPFTKEEYAEFINALLKAQRVISKEFETKELFQACQPIEEIARSGFDAPRFGPLKPVGLLDPLTNKRPWAALQLRAEDTSHQAYNMVGFQTNLTFSEQKRVFRLIPGLQNAEFARYGVMHKNIFLDAPKVMESTQRFISANNKVSVPIFLAGQISGTEGYCEAIRSGLQAALEIIMYLKNIEGIRVPVETAYGALLQYASDKQRRSYQPMHVNFGIFKPLESAIRNKTERYMEYAKRGATEMAHYVDQLNKAGIQL